MTNQSITTFFIILAMMSASLFFHQVEELNKLESQSTISQNKINHSIEDFHRYSTKYQQAVKVKNGSDFMRGSFDFILSPLTSIINYFLDNVTDIEEEANQTIYSATAVINEYQKISRESEKIQQQRIEQIVSWRNIGLIMCVFSAIATLFTRVSQLPNPTEFLPIKTQPACIKKALIAIIAGAIISCIPSLEGIAFKLVIPSIIIAYFIVQSQLQNKQTPWQKRTIITIAVSLLVSSINYGFYHWQEIATEYAISGFLLGLFIASSIQYSAIPLSTRQFFSVASVFTVARLIAALSTAEFGAELTILEGLLSISAVLWIIQTHAQWVKQLKFDILLSWFTVYCATTFVFGNFYQAELLELIIAYLIITISGGVFLTYHLSQVHKKNYLFVGIEDKGSLSQITVQDK